MTDVVIRNIGTVVTGDVAAPLAQADTIVVSEGRIQAVGRDLPAAGAREIDAAGAMVFPGLIDSHVHPAIGDFTPRQRTLDFITSYLHGGVTTMISAGEPHVPGRPRDRVGTKALALLASRAFRNAPPSGVKVRAGSLLLEHGLVEEDFAELAAEGIGVVGEIGISSVHDPEEARRMTRWAQKHGMRVIVHTGGASIPGSAPIGADFVLTVGPDVAAHVNGGPTAPPIADVERMLTETGTAIEVVQCGNVRALRDVIELASRLEALDRVIVGSDSPSGTGVIPLAMLRTMSWIAALGGVAPAVAVAMATGNTARVHGLAEGLVAEGAPADLLVVDTPRGSQAGDALEALAIGDTPAVSVVMIDGDVKVFGSRNTPPAVRPVAVPWMAGGGH